jgi:hypothetical protein
MSKVRYRVLLILSCLDDPERRGMYSLEALVLPDSIFQ